MKKLILLITGLMFCISMVVAQTQYKPVDKGSKVHFVIRNFGIKTGGDFSGLQGSIKFDPDNYSASSFDVTVEANTVDTDNGTRDSHLKKAEYFNADTYKTIRLKSTKVVLSSISGRYYMFGDLTIKGVTKAVEIGFGATQTSDGFVFDGEFTINRRDFGVGGKSAVLSDSLEVQLSIKAVK